VAANVCGGMDEKEMLEHWGGPKKKQYAAALFFIHPIYISNKEKKWRRA
jgi:hypothetical protein